MIVGKVTSGSRLRVLEHGKLVADIPNTALTDDAPLYHRPMSPWEAPVPHTRPGAHKVQQHRRLHADFEAPAGRREHMLQALDF